MTRTTLNITTNPLQNVLYTIRKKLGYVKYVCLDGGHRDVRYRWQIDRLNRQAAGLLDRLARDRILKPAAVPMESNIELHTLCCHDHVTMGIWSIWSLVRWAEGRLSLVVHSDGSLTQDDVGRFRRFFTNVRFVWPEEGRQWVEKRFAGSEFEFLRAFHREHCFGLRLLDFHMPERARVVVMMDTDVLFFHRPVDLLTRCIEAQEGPALTSFRDDFDWLSVMGTKEHIKAVFKIKIEHEFNAGMVVMPRFGDTQFRFFERMLRSYEPEWRKSYFAEQALWMLAAGEYGWRALPGSYQIGHESNPSDAVAIHYVSNRAVRPRFFTEGLPRLIHTLRC